MIMVSTIVNASTLGGEKKKTLKIDSDRYSAGPYSFRKEVIVRLGDETITVYGEDLIKAVQNAMNN